MNANEVVELIKKEKPNLLGKMSEKKAAALVRNAFLQIGKHIDAAGEGVIKVPGLGNFRVKQVERERNGQKVNVKRVAFRVTRRKNKDEQQE